MAPVGEAVPVGEMAPLCTTIYKDVMTSFYFGTGVCEIATGALSPPNPRLSSS